MRRNLPKTEGAGRSLGLVGEICGVTDTLQWAPTLGSREPYLHSHSFIKVGILRMAIPFGGICKRIGAVCQLHPRFVPPE